MQNILKTTCFIILLISANLSLAAGQSKVNLTDGLAVSGYDPVAYFTASSAVPGNPDISTEWNGVRWQFSSEENRQRFVENPEQYAPKYGGFCAYAASKGALAPVDPTAWTIVNNRLYLNFSHDVKELWSQDTVNNIEKADKNWPGLSSGS